MTKKRNQEIKVFFFLFSCLSRKVKKRLAGLHSETLQQRGMLHYQYNCEFSFSLSRSMFYFRSKVKVILTVVQILCLLTNLSICARNLVSKKPLVLSRSDTLPLSSRPLAVKSMSTFLTISPKYMPLIIFSYLEAEATRASYLTPWRSHTAQHLPTST